MVPIVVLGGTGDTYLVCSLLRAFEARHGSEAKVIVRTQYDCIAEMFRVPFERDDQAIMKAEGDLAFQRDYDNDIGDGRMFYAHPCMLRTRLRMDHMTAKTDASQGDMYKTLLRIPPATPLALPKVPYANVRKGTVLIIPGARSWPHDEPEFWNRIEHALRAAGWTVEVNDRSWPLRKLLLHCAASEWVIGAQCGVMSILVTGRFPCRKTLAVPNIDDNLAHAFPARDTYPYGYVTKFSNFDFDIEEFKIGTTQQEQAELAESIVNGANAFRLWPHDPSPVNSVQMPLTPGDFLDRLAVLTVKRARFDVRRKAAIEREYQRHVEARYGARLPEHGDLFDQLVDLHRENFDLLEQAVPAALGAQGGLSVEAHVKAIGMNQRRVAIKREIDARCRAAYTEVKSYYGDDDGEWRPQEEPAIEYDDSPQFVPTPVMRWNQLPLNVPGMREYPAPPLHETRRPTLVESVNGHNIVHLNGSYLLVPQSMGSIQLDTMNVEQHPRIGRYPSAEKARAAAHER